MGYPDIGRFRKIVGHFNAFFGSYPTAVKIRNENTCILRGIKMKCFGSSQTWTILGDHFNAFGVLSYGQGKKWGYFWGLLKFRISFWVSLIFLIIGFGRKQ